MNILLSIHHNLSKNQGAPGVTYQLYQEYERLGHHASIFSFDSIPSYVPNKLKTLFFPIFLFWYVKINRRKQKIDVIDASSGDAWILNLLKIRKKKSGTFHISRSHGLEHTVHYSRLDQQRMGNIKLSWKYFIYRGGIRLWEVATSFRKADGCLFLNDYDLNYSIEKLRINRQYSRTISNGLPDYFINIPVNIFPVQNLDKVHIVQIGSYIPNKGIFYTAKAMNSVLKKYPNVELSFIGTGCMAEKVLEDYDPAVQNQIQVISKYEHEELPDLLQGKHILLFPSLAEGFGLVLIEAMACGLAPVATATQGPLMILKDGRDSKIIPPADYESIESSLIYLFSDPNLLYQLRHNAYKTAQQYKWSAIAKETIHFYEEVSKKEVT
jgi:glycosyltransferase involved in cell wall biosynthesis